MPLSLAAYKAQIAEWKRLYGMGEAQWQPTNLTQVELPICFRCGRNRNQMHRHHVANDFFFACQMPGVLAARYISFHPDDVRWLCKDCHKLAHRRYHPIIKNFWIDRKRIVYTGDLKKLETEKLNLIVLYKERCRNEFFQWVERTSKYARTKRRLRRHHTHPRSR